MTDDKTIKDKARRAGWVNRAHAGAFGVSVPRCARWWRAERDVRMAPRMVRRLGFV